MSSTIRDVARAAGVSASTVSRVFNDKTLVKPDTRERILQVARQLRYVPNGTARALSLQKTQVLGFIVPEPHREFFSEIIRGIDETAQQRGYTLLISSSHNRLDSIRTALRTLNGRIDGLMILSPFYDAPALQDDLPPDTPTVFLMTTMGETPYDGVGIDNVGGGAQAARHLVEAGHRRVAIIHGEEDNRDTQERRKGYRQALQAAGLPVDPALEREGAFTRESGYAQARALLALDDPPTAIFAINDYMAMGVLSAVHDAGLRVPDDVAVVGFDDILSARYANPPLSSVAVPTLEMSRAATLQLIERAESDVLPDGPVRTVLPTSLEVRASSRPA